MAADGSSGSGDDARLNDLADRLRVVAESLDDVMYDMLRAARADGISARPTSDRTLVQARRAIEKAEYLLRRTVDTGARPEA